MKVLITGASGFIGSFLCDESLHRRFRVWAGIRSRSSRKWLQSEWLNFVTLDMTNTDTLYQQLNSFKQKQGKWDVIIHAGGATKCLNKEDFIANNFECTKNLVETLEQLDMLPQQFLYLSSLSVLGPSLDESNPQPNTAYGESKLMSENYLKDKFASLENSPHTLLPNENSTLALLPSENSAHALPLRGSGGLTIFRPTGVYGPREKDYLMMMKSIKHHYDFAVGFKPQIITFVYVQDLVNAILSAIGNEKSYGKTYAVSDGNSYSSRAFSDLIQKELDKRFVLHITAPLFILKAVCNIGDLWSRLTGKISTLNKDKYNILSQRDWQCDITPIKEDLGYEPQWDLERGVKESVKWYKENKWL